MPSKIPPQAAASMKVRSTLLMELSNIIQSRGMTQAESAELFGVAQPRISDLVRGKIDLFSLDTLMNMTSTAGMSPVVKLSKPKALPARRVGKKQAELIA
jgi:predicted XRE-type DNA-binding protein